MVPFWQSLGQNLLKIAANCQNFAANMWWGGKTPSRPDAFRRCSRSTPSR